PVVDARVVQELPHGMVMAVAVVRIGVQIPGEDEVAARTQSASASAIVVDVPAPRSATNVVRPEADLVVVAATVAVLLAVEGGRGRMRDQEVHGPSSDQDRQVPVA